MRGAVRLPFWPAMACAPGCENTERFGIMCRVGSSLAIPVCMAASLVATRRFSFRRVVFTASEAPRDSQQPEIAGALIALDPGGYPAAPPPIRVQFRCLWGQGPRVMRRWGRLYRILDACHPREPHCYLSLIAIHPTRQRRGLTEAIANFSWFTDWRKRV